MKAWARDALQFGARSAHAYVRRADKSEEPLPQAGHPADIRVQFHALGHLWSLVGTETIAAIVNRMVDVGWTECGPPPSLEDVRNAAKTFRWKAAPGVGGIHVRQAPCLSDGMVGVPGK